MKKNKLAIRNNSYQLSSMPQMQRMAVMLRSHIESNNLYTIIVGKKYAHVDGWCYAGGLMGVMPRIKSLVDLSNDKEKKWKADVDLIRIKGNIVVGNGSALCSNLEAKKRTFDEYAVMSMAQTRAIGKAFRNTIGWVMKLGGYESTPSEEMHKVDAGVPEINISTKEEKGIQPETQEIIELMNRFGFKTVPSKFAAIKRLTGIKLDNWRMTQTEARKVLSSILQKKKELKK